MIRSAKDKEILKEALGQKLVEHNAFWSHNVTSSIVPDEELIERVFIYLDLDDIAHLFEIYPKSYVKKVWRERLAIGGDYLSSLNIFIALCYFGIKRPEQYIARVEKEHFAQLFSPD